MLIPLGLLTITQGLDLLTTEVSLRVGGTEGNPFMAPVRSAAGLEGLLAVKCLLLAYWFWSMVTSARAGYRRLILRYTWALIAFYTLVIANNLIVIARAIH